MIIAGFDPGSSKFGVGIVEVSKGSVKYLASNEISLKGSDFGLKMKNLLEELSKINEKYSPDESAIEEGFLGKNVRSMNVLSKVRGVVLAHSIFNGKQLTFYSPREIKTSVTGNGNASKEQVKTMVRHIFGIKNVDMGFDESDAIAVAYCHYSLSRGK